MRRPLLRRDFFYPFYYSLTIFLVHCHDRSIMQSPVSDHSKARQVCRFCKARKRRCDKALPSCSTCVRYEESYNLSGPDFVTPDASHLTRSIY